MSSLAAMPVLLLGIVVLAAVVIGVLAVIGMARRQAAQESPPPSAPSDFVGPVSSGLRRRWPERSPAEDERKRACAL